MGRNGTMEKTEINSSFLNETLEIKIYIPEGFSPFTSYHVAIMQDGNDYFQMGRIATLSDKLHENEEIADTIFAGIHYADKYDRWKKYYPNGEQNEAYIEFLVHEVVPMLKERVSNIESFALMGDSLAGTLALMTTLKHPEIFSKIIMQSPFVNDTVLQTTEDAESLKDIDIYHTIGTKETNVDMTNGTEANFINPNRKLNETLENKDGNYTYHELEEGDHTWKYWQNDMTRALTTIFQ